MPFCPECDAEIEGETYELDEGDVIECPECGAGLEVTSADPVEFEPLEDDFYDDDFDYDDEWD